METVRDKLDRLLGIPLVRKGKYLYDRFGNRLCMDGPGPFTTKPIKNIDYSLSKDIYFLSSPDILQLRAVFYFRGEDLFGIVDDSGIIRICKFKNGEWIGNCALLHIKPNILYWYVASNKKRTKIDGIEFSKGPWPSGVKWQEIS